MPGTAKLSRKFYDTFGDKFANELVEWFNQVDATYRVDLRELNELNFGRFDAKLEQRVAELDAKIEQRYAQLDAKVDQRMAELRKDLADMKSELVRWMFMFWAPTAIMLPHSGVGTRTPAPTKLSPAVSRTAQPMFTDTCTSAGAMPFGRM